MLLGERIRDCRGRNEAARNQKLAEALARALLLGEGLLKVVLADQASFHQHRAQPTPTRICRIHTCAYQPPAENKASFASLPTAPSAGRGNSSSRAQDPALLPN